MLVILPERGEKWKLSFGDSEQERREREVFRVSILLPMKVCSPEWRG